MTEIILSTYNQLVDTLGTPVPYILGTVLLLLIGLFVAKFIAAGQQDN